MTGQRRKQAQMGEHSRMNRTEFMRQLESLLQNISATEREEALQYYNEYFNDAGPENEQSDASQTAQAQVVSPQKKEGMSTGMIVLIVILCILASPVILGVASAGIGVAAGLIAAWLGLIVGFGATAAALILILIALVVAGIISLFTHPFVGMGLIGAGLICGGVGLLFLMLTVAMAGIATPAICCWIGGLFQKRGKAEA